MLPKGTPSTRRGRLGPRESVWRQHSSGSAHAGTGSAWPRGYPRKGAPFDGLPRSNDRPLSCLAVQVESKFGV
jgi:hypothetical protein